ncbi:MAG TPA: hypothetical protein VL947_02010 [Cytophagales bacterium]|nr:hypothetical protein [Cytophagales bacterium]
MGLCHGQKLLFHKNDYREAFYKTGDVITFKLKHTPGRFSGSILGFEGDSLILFSGYKVNPAHISHLYVDQKTKGWYIFRYKYVKIFTIAGIGYLIIDILNRGILDPGTLKFSGTMLFSALVAKCVISNKHKIKGRRKLLIIH